MLDGVFSLSSEKLDLDACVAQLVEQTSRRSLEALGMFFGHLRSPVTEAGGQGSHAFLASRPGSRLRSGLRER